MGVEGRKALMGKKGLREVEVDSDDDNNLLYLSSVCAQQAPARLGFPGALPQRRVVWMWFGAFPGAFGLGRAQPQRRGTSP